MSNLSLPQEFLFLSKCRFLSKTSIRRNDASDVCDAHVALSRNGDDVSRKFAPPICQIKTRNLKWPKGGNNLRKVFEIPCHKLLVTN